MGVSLFFVGGVYLRLVDVLFVLMIFGVFGVFGFVIKNINNIVFIYCLSYNSYDNVKLYVIGLNIYFMD